MTNQAERDLHRREYQRIVEELQALAARANMSAAIIMTEFEDGVPRLEDVGLESLRRLLAPLGYVVEEMADLSPVAVAYGAPPVDPRLDERFRIVDWLRQLDAVSLLGRRTVSVITVAEAVAALADAIRRGEHENKETPDA